VQECTTEGEKEAYRRGLLDGERAAIIESLERAHSRLDNHGQRLMSIERVMYAGLGVITIIEVFPRIAELLIQ